MPEHQVIVSTPSQNLERSDLRIVINSDGERLGEILISRGTFDYRPNRWRGAVALPWERLDELMREYSEGRVVLKS